MTTEAIEEQRLADKKKEAGPYYKCGVFFLNSDKTFNVKEHPVFKILAGRLQRLEDYRNVCFTEEVTVLKAVEKDRSLIDDFAIISKMVEEVSIETYQHLYTGFTVSFNQVVNRTGRYKEDLFKEFQEVEDHLETRELDAAVVFSEIGKAFVNGKMEPLTFTNAGQISYDSPDDAIVIAARVINFAERIDRVAANLPSYGHMFPQPKPESLGQSFKDGFIDRYRQSMEIIRAVIHFLVEADKNNARELIQISRDYKEAVELYNKITQLT